jgi:hypothetical protein
MCKACFAYIRAFVAREAVRSHLRVDDIRFKGEAAAPPHDEARNPFAFQDTRLKPFTGGSNGQRALLVVQEELEQDTHVEEAHAQAAHLRTRHVNRMEAGAATTISVCN